ncbi:Uncharacterised protein [Burkholderia pseudomallei]|nr:Uncharacterised protein [Burkholderia pseudomallei]
MSRAKKTAEENYQAAFERLRDGKPRVLPKGTPVSQNNVAKEAGNDPSALKSARFPTVIANIQAWLEIHKSQEELKQKRTKQQREARLDLKAQVSVLKRQRDRLQSQRVRGHEYILELMEQIEALQTVADDRQPSPSPLRGKKR